MINEGCEECEGAVAAAAEIDTCDFEQFAAKDRM